MCLSLFTCLFPGGCAFYGHSCFGGHGKRSMPDLNLRPIPQVEIPMKFIQDPAHFELPANYDNAIDENSYSEESTEQQHDQDLKYAVYGLFRQWVRTKDREGVRVGGN